MAQHDYIISNQTFPNTRADLNNALQAIATNNSGSSAPTTLYAGQFWLDTNTPSSTTWSLYIHDGSDNILFAEIDTSANTVNFTDSALDVVTDTTPQLGGNLDTNGNNINFGNNDKANFGASNELQIYKATGGNSYIQETGTSNLRICGTEVFLRDGADTENLAVFRTNGANELYYDNSKKFETASSGVFIDTTSTNTGVDASSTGFYFRDGGQLRVARDNSQPIVANRLNGDGVILDLRKDGATVGQLSAQSGGMGFNVGSSASEALRIDTSGNVLVGKTSADSGGSVGTELLSGRMFLRRSGGAPIIADRDTSNGDIVLLRRAGTNVGIFGGVGTELFLGSNAGSGSYLNFGSNRIIPASNTGGNRDNVIDLGNSASRFSDLYLGGNIYLGGTGSANALDDYEEGSFTCTVSGQNSGSFSASGASYKKIGSMVNVNIGIFNPGSVSLSGVLRLSLPFTPAGAGTYSGFNPHYVGSVVDQRGLTPSGDYLAVTTIAGQNYLNLREIFHSATTEATVYDVNPPTNTLLHISITYFTN